MILVDSRVGSRELLTGLRNIGAAADTVNDLTTDFQWDGYDSTGTILIGCERKTIGDLLTSIREKRLAGGQVGRAIDCYDRYYLIVEGPWRRGEGGLLEVGWPWHTPRGGFRYAEIVHFLDDLCEMGGVRVIRTHDEDATIATLVDLYENWQKPWEEREGKRVIYAPAPIPPRTGKFFQPKATPVQSWVYQLPGLGDKMTFELAPFFSTPRAIVDMQSHEWAKLPGIGPGRLDKIWNWIHHGRTT